MAFGAGAAYYALEVAGLGDPKVSSWVYRVSRYLKIPVTDDYLGVAYQNAGLVSDVFPGDAVAVGVHFNKGVPGYFADKFPVLLKRGFVNGR
jgi:hypothetical protein